MTFKTPIRHRDGRSLGELTSNVRPTGTYGYPGYGEPHPTAFGHEPCDQPTAEQIDADHAEALVMNAEIDEFMVGINVLIARARRTWNLSEKRLNGFLLGPEPTDLYEN